MGKYLTGTDNDYYDNDIVKSFNDGKTVVSVDLIKFGVLFN